MKVGAVKLKQYLLKNGIRASHFARTLGKFPSTFSRIISGENCPDLATATLIEQETKGAVACEDWLKDIAKKSR